MIDPEFAKKLAIVSHYEREIKHDPPSQTSSIKSIDFNLTSVEFSFANFLVSAKLYESNKNQPAILAISSASTFTHLFSISDKNPYVSIENSLKMGQLRGYWTNCDVDIHWAYHELSENAGKLLNACSDGKLRLWRGKISAENMQKNNIADDGISNHVEYKCHNGKISKAKFVRNTNACISIGMDKKIVVTDLISEQNIANLSAHQCSLTSLELHHSSPIFAVGEDSGYIVIWDLRMGKPISDFNSQFSLNNNLPKMNINNKHDGKITSLSFDSSGCLLASGSEDAIIKVWDLRKQLLVKTVAGHREKISETVFAEGDNSMLISASVDGDVKVWDWFNQIAINQIELGKNKLSFFKTTKTLDKAFAGFFDKTLYMYEGRVIKNEGIDIEKFN